MIDPDEIILQKSTQSFDTIKTLFQEAFMDGYLICQVCNIQDYMQVYFEEYSSNFFNVMPLNQEDESLGTIEKSCIIDQYDQLDDIDFIN